MRQTQLILGTQGEQKSCCLMGNNTFLEEAELWVRVIKGFYDVSLASILQITVDPP